MGNVLSERNRSAQARVAIVLLFGVLLQLTVAVGTRERALAAGTTPSGLRVSGNRIVDGTGRSVRLLGVNRSGSEYACIQGWGFFDGPSDAASVQAIARWGANAVRVPLNEGCWLGINGAPEWYSGAYYRDAIRDYVNTLNQNGLVAVLELHWSGSGTTKATGMEPMPNRDHTPEFWRSVAATFRSNDSVVFDLFNEPFPDGNRDTDEAWRCWRDGGTCDGMAFQAAGMQELVDAVRGTGAQNVLLLGGVQYANGLSRWLEHKPVDPLNNLAASWHAYNFNWYTTPAQWDQTVAPVARQVPLVVGEMGQDDGGTAFVQQLTDWLDQYDASYLGWVWTIWGSSLDLVKDYNGTPTATWGQWFKDRIARSAAPAPPTATPTTPPATATPQPTATATAPPATATPQPTPTVPAPTTGTLVARPSDDAQVRSDRPTRRYGIETRLRVDSDPVTMTYLRFALSGLNGRVVSSAKLRLYVSEAGMGTRLSSLSDISWSERTITYTNRPATDGRVLADNGGRLAVGTWLTFNITPVVARDGTYSFAVAGTSTDGVGFTSRNARTNRPELVITYMP